MMNVSRKLEKPLGNMGDHARMSDTVKAIHQVSSRQKSNILLGDAESSSNIEASIHRVGTKSTFCFTKYTGSKSSQQTGLPIQRIVGPERCASSTGSNSVHSTKFSTEQEGTISVSSIRQEAGRVISAPDAFHQSQRNTLLTAEIEASSMPRLRKAKDQNSIRDGKQKLKAYRHPAFAVSIMRAWATIHSESPTTEEKRELARRANITLAQVTTWFQNKRKQSRKFH